MREVKEKDSIDTATRRAPEAEHCENTAQIETGTVAETQGGYNGSRFNALRHGVLSAHTVLPWEDKAEYETLLNALVAEYVPRGPTQESLVEEIAGVIWRKRRLQLAEAASYRVGVKAVILSFPTTLETVLIKLERFLKKIR